MRQQSFNMISSSEKTSLDRNVMATHSGNTASAPVSVAERIAALQGDKGRSSTSKPSTALKLKPPIAKSKRTNAVANRIASFQNTKTTDDDLFRTDAISSHKIQINELGFPSSVAASPDVTKSGSSVFSPARIARVTRSPVMSPTWKASTPMSKAPVAGKELKFCAALLTQSPQVVTERDCDGGELEAVEVAVIKLDYDVDEDVNDDEKVDDNNVTQTEKSCNESGTELPIFTYTINYPTSEQNKLPDTNAASVSISFDSLPQEFLNSTWNLSPEQCQELIESSDDLFIVKESFSSDDLFIVKASNSEVDAKCVTPKKLTEIPVTNEIKEVPVESSDNTHGLEVSNVKGELLPEDHPPKIQRTEKTSLVSEASAILLSKRAAKQGKINQVSPTGVDNFRTEEVAQNKFHFEGVNNETVISSISVMTPAETIQSSYTRIFGDDPVDEQKNNLPIDNSFIVQNGEDGFFNAKQLMTKSIASKEILIGVIESSLGVLADTVAEGYDLVASKYQDRLGMATTA